MVSLRTLCGIAGVGGMFTACTGYTLQMILQNRVRDSPVYKKAMEIVNNDTAGQKFLGVPIKSQRVDVGNPANILSLRYCQLEVPVYGPKCKGKVYLEADRLTDKDDWNLYKLELEILDELGGKVAIINKDPVLRKEVLE